MKIKKTFTNEEIFYIATKLNSVFKENSNNIYLPVKTLFFIQKNKQTFIKLAEEIDRFRNEIIYKYGEPTEEKDSYNIPDERMPKAKKEFDDLLNIEQEVEINTIKFSDIENYSMSFEQMEALFFMIEED